MRSDPLSAPRRAWACLLAVLPQWAATRVIVLGALALAHLVVDRVHPATAVSIRTVHQGLLSWDAGYYNAIARLGYGPLGHQGWRFFPLFPLFGRALALAPGIDAGAALLLIANLSSLIGTALLYALVWGAVPTRGWPVEPSGCSPSRHRPTC